MMGYLRTVLSTKESSQRAILLTKYIITANPSHYAIWTYRRELILALKYELRLELEWLDDIMLDNPKSYQLWHHRQWILTQLDLETLIDDEMTFLGEMVNMDSKNYHCWAYRYFNLE